MYPTVRKRCSTMLTDSAFPFSLVFTEGGSKSEHISFDPFTNKCTFPNFPFNTEKFLLRTSSDGQRLLHKLCEHLKRLNSVWRLLLLQRESAGRQKKRIVSIHLHKTSLDGIYLFMFLLLEKCFESQGFWAVII